MGNKKNPSVALNIQSLIGEAAYTILPERQREYLLTHEQMAAVLADVAKIDDKALRLSLVDKLMCNQ